MKFRFPLYTQIITVFAINIVLLALVRMLVVGSHFNLGWEQFFYAPINDRLRSLGFVIHRQMRVSPKEDWNNVLDEFGNYYGVKLYVFNSRGQQIAGEPIVVPPKVAAKLVLPLNFPPLPDLPKGPNAIAKMQRFSLLDQMPMPFPPVGLLIHTTAPDRFWIGTFLPMPFAREPGTLLAVTPNLWQTRLVENYGQLFILILGVFCFSFIIWWPFVYGITRALGKLTRATERIAEGNFDNPIAIRRSDEIGRLAIAINSMSNRLNGYLSGQKRFLGDIAHELSSPVARLQVAHAILETTHSQEQTTAIQDIREDLEQMSHLINELLAYSKTSVVGKTIELSSLDLEPIVKTAILRTCPNYSVELSMQSGLKCLGDRLLLDRAFGNVLRNAVRYAGEGGTITIQASQAGNDTIITFSDNGPGVPEEAIELLGQPFYRPEPSRSRSFGGVGLGLAIVKACIEACAGKVIIRNCQPTGLRVEIRLCSGSN